MAEILPKLCFSSHAPWQGWLFSSQRQIGLWPCSTAVPSLLPSHPPSPCSLSPSPVDSPQKFLTFHSHCYTFDQAFIPSYQYYFKTHLISFIDFIPLSPSLPHTPSSLSVSPERSLKCKSEHAVHFLRTL